MDQVDVIEVILDRYEIWKNFPSGLDTSDFKFFMTKTAYSNLGIIINLNWFQPFESLNYSCK